MITGKILDSFSMSTGKIFIVDFINTEYSPSQGGKLFFDGTYFYIKPYGFKHDYYKGDALHAKNVWSCILENLNGESFEINIPNGSDILVEL